MQGLITKFAYAGAPMVVLGLLAWLPEHKETVLTLIGPLAAVMVLGAYFVFRVFPDQEVQAARDAHEAPPASAGEGAESLAES